jgi:hypothetical protein
MAEWFKAAVLKTVLVIPASLTKSTNPRRNHRVLGRFVLHPTSSGFIGFDPAVVTVW